MPYSNPAGLRIERGLLVRLERGEAGPAPGGLPIGGVGNAHPAGPERAAVRGAEDLAKRAEIEQQEMTLLAAADADERARPSPATGVEGGGAALGAAVAQAPAGGRGGRLGLCGHGPEGAPASAGHPASGSGPAGVVHGGRTARPARRPACGIVPVRQQPETAKGVMFVSREDETGSVHVIVWPKLKAQLRGPLLRSKLMAVKGTWRRDGDVRNFDRWAGRGFDSAARRAGNEQPGLSLKTVSRSSPTAALLQSRACHICGSPQQGVGCDAPQA